jgi:hypothetical protein
VVVPLGLPLVRASPPAAAVLLVATMKDLADRVRSMGIVRRVVMVRVRVVRLVVLVRSMGIVRRVVMVRVRVVRLVVLARSMGIVRRAVRVVTIGVSRRKKTFQLAR